MSPAGCTIPPPFRSPSPDAASTMAKGVKSTRRLLVIYYLLALHLVAGSFIAEKFFDSYTVVRVANDQPASEPLHPDAGDGAAVPGIAPTPPAAAAPGDTVFLAEAIPRLIIPVAGVGPEQLANSFSEARGEGRPHEAIDIPAPAGTAVLAAADGKILRFFDSVPGGITIYQLSADGRYLFYYAHLQSRADDISVGDEVKQGRTIGYVGDTGNAGTGNYHLHFAISIITEPGKTWGGHYIDPYPLLKQGR